MNNEIIEKEFSKVYGELTPHNNTQLRGQLKEAFVAGWRASLQCLISVLDEDEDA